MSSTTHVLPAGSIACPYCGAQTEATPVGTFLCHRCWRCWRRAGRQLAHIDALACPAGCANRRVCLAALGERSP